VRCYRPPRRRIVRDMNTGIAPPSHQAISAQTRSRPGRVTGRLKLAIDAVVEEGLDPYEAAAKVGMHARSMRLALNRRHVLAYLRQQREVLRQTASAQNIHHAIAMRAGSTNEMAKLGAMKFIEAIEDEVQRRGHVPALTPGLVIQIVNNSAPSREPEKMINITPSVPVDAADDAIADDAPIFRPRPW
jgi:hypothetical protein